MRSKVLLFVTAVVLGTGLAIALLVPQSRRQSEATPVEPPGPPDEIQLTGKVRDFHVAHPDFEVVPSRGFGQYAGLVARTEGPNDRPVYGGPGFKVLSPARDPQGRPIAPHLANQPCAGVVTTFEIIDGQVVPGVPFAARVTVVGAAIVSGSIEIPVTTQVRIGSQTFDPFGPYTNPVTGNVNDDKNPRHHVFPNDGTFPAGTPISIAGTSWLPNGGGFKPHLVANSSQASPYVLTLRDGDDVPDIQGFQGQASVETFLRPYIDTATGKVTLEPYQAIYLFELGTKNLNSPAADFQDLVILVSLATDADQFTTGGGLVTSDNLNDTAAVLDTVPSTGGITSPETFHQWFSDVLGQNMSTLLPVTLVRSGGIYVYDDSLDPRYSGLGGFYPIDDRLFGNEGASHNHHFTWELSARFTYVQAAAQYFKYIGNGDVWVFVNDSLAIDLGGVHGELDQRIDLERLCLADGQSYWLRLFLAQRSAPHADVRIETNIVFQGSFMPTIIDQYD